MWQLVLNLLSLPIVVMAGVRRRFVKRRPARQYGAPNASRIGTGGRRRSRSR